MSKRPRPDSSKRELPRDIDAEASILGGIILRNEALSYIVDLETEDFYDVRHRVVFNAMRNLEAAGKPIDTVMLENEIAKAGKLEAIGGPALLGELTLRVPTVDNVEHYADIVRTKRITRNVMVMLGELLDGAYHGEGEGEALVHDVTSAMMTIRTGGDRPIVTVSELIAKEAARVTDDVRRRLSGETVYAGVPTGIMQIDNVIGGNPIGLMSLVIARPGNGKSTVALAYARASRRVAGPDYETLVASYEDGGDSFGLRGLGQESGLDVQLMRARKITADELVTVAAGVAAARDRTEGFLDANGLTAEALARRVRRENIRRASSGKKPYKQLVTDFIQAMPLPQWARTREEGVGHNSGVLRDIAVREKMASVVMCQLNRDIERRDDHRPRISDIRDSGALEQDGKFIVGLYRPWLYGDHSVDRNADGSKRKAPETELHVLVLKNHQGAINNAIEQYWDLATNTLYNSVMEYQEERARRIAAENQFRAKRK